MIETTLIIIGLILSIFLLIEVFTTKEIIEKHFTDIPESPPAPYPWDDIPWDCDGVDHLGDGSARILDMKDGTYACVRPEKGAIDGNEEEESIPKESNSKVANNRRSKKYIYKKQSKRKLHKKK